MSDPRTFHTQFDIMVIQIKEASTHRCNTNLAFLLNDLKVKTPLTIVTL